MKRRKPGLPIVAALAALLGGVILFTARPVARATLPTGRGTAGIPPSPESVAVGYETEDMKAGLVTKVLGVCLGIVVVSVVLLFVMIHSFHRNDAQVSLTAQQTARIQPPAPNLQSDPDRELRDLDARERHRIDDYAWADADHIRGRIPISRAEAIVTGRSLEPAP